jgi:hypothetical protein
MTGKKVSIHAMGCQTDAVPRYGCAVHERYSL